MQLLYNNMVECIVKHQLLSWRLNQKLHVEVENVGEKSIVQQQLGVHAVKGILDVCK